MKRPLIVLALLLPAVPAARACLLPDVVAAAPLQARERLEVLDGRCEEGLELLRAGRGSEAVPFLRGAAALPTVLQSVTLPLAEALFQAGTPVVATLQAFEAALVEPAGTALGGDGQETRAVVEARLLELSLRLDVGEAKALLDAAPGRPAGPWLTRRAAADAAETGRPIGTPPVGVLMPISGRLGPLGRKVLDGVALAAGDRLVLVRDTGSGVPAGSLLGELTGDGAMVIVGPVDRNAAALASDAAAVRQVPLLRVDVGGDDRTLGASDVRVGPSRLSETSAIIDRARREGLTRFLVVGSTSAYGAAFATAARSAIQAAGLVAMEPVLYAPELGDLTQVGRLAAQRRPDVVLLADVGARAGLVARYLAAAGVVSRGLSGRPRTEGEVRFVVFAAPSEWRETTFADGDTRYLQGLWVASEWDPARGRSASAFSAAGQRAFGRPMSVLEAVGFDAASLALELGVSVGGSSPTTPREAARQALAARVKRRVLTSQGVLGGVRLDSSGEPVRTAPLFRLRGSAFEPVEAR